MKQLLATAALGLLLSACQVVGPDYTLPEKSAVKRDDLQGQLAGEGSNVVSAPVPADWWKLYK
ncbi:TolC family protein, partial [Pseudomonas syringae]|nr:TolC family protein [Pseudomonas syringae]